MKTTRRKTAVHPASLRKVQSKSMTWLWIKKINLTIFEHSDIKYIQSAAQLFLLTKQNNIYIDRWIDMQTGGYVNKCTDVS